MGRQRDPVGGLVALVDRAYRGQVDLVMGKREARRFARSPGICDELMFAFLSEGLTQVGQALEETERIEVEPVACDAAMGMIESGEIRDGKTIATLLFYRTFLRRR